MRITQKLMADSVVQRLMDRTSALFKAENTVSTGKRITRASDDPVGMERVLEFRTTIATVDQYGRNIAQGNSWLQLSDSVLGNVDTLLIRAKELAVYQATGTATPTTRTITAEEVDVIREDIRQLANTKLGSSYIFSGQRSDTPPFSTDAYAGDSGKIPVIVGEGVTVDMNLTGDEVFTNGSDIFQILGDLKDGLLANDTTKIADQVDRLNAALEQVMNARAKVGARLNRLDTAQNHWTDFRANIEEMLSDTEDVDLAKAYTDLTSKESAYQATLNASAMILQPSLVDFLR